MAQKMKFDAVIQIRLSSQRLKNKGILKFGKLYAIELLIKRLMISKKINKIIIATTKNKEDLFLKKFLIKNKVYFFSGNEKNVLERFFKCAQKFDIKNIIRITGDNPFTDPEIIDQYISYYKKHKPDFLYEGESPKLPDGVGIEIFNFKTLKKAFEKANKKFDKEHVTPFMKNKMFKVKTMNFQKNFSNFRLTLDDFDDYKKLKKIFNYYKPNYYFSTKKIVNDINQKKIKIKFDKNKRDQGSKMHIGEKNWLKALNIVPGGNGLISKRPNLYLPHLWPTYYKKAKGCNIWDLNGKRFIDLCMMGVGTNLLGYANDKINSKVKRAIENGNMSTLNCLDEINLAEKLVNMHKWASSAKFARTGAEANAMAIRIARSYTKNDKIAFCGYHGWHDWYLSTNLKNKKNLGEHLLEGIKISGVPKSLKNTIYPFSYNNFEEFKKIYLKKKFGTVIMEVKRNIDPEKNFLKKISNFCKKNKVLLIFDECTSGFRENYGGLHLKYQVYPDLCMFGKALGNGHAITAVIGKKNIMKHASHSFISSTFWTERIGFVAGIETLNEMYRKKSWKYVSDLGNYIKKKWAKLAKENNLNISIMGLESIPSFVINSKKFLEYKTYITQEMLKKGYLCTNVIFVSTAHNKKIVNNYLKHLSSIFRKIAYFEKNNINAKEFLQTSVCKTSFSRLN